MTMLYKYPAKDKTPLNYMHGDHFDYIITDDVDGALKDGWSLTTDEAKKPKVEKKPTRTAKRK